MSGKARLSVSVDAGLLVAARAAVAAGRAASVSAWVYDALRLKAAHEVRLAALDAWLGEYEAAHGEITAEEIEEAMARRAGERPGTTSGQPPRSRPAVG